MGVSGSGKSTVARAVADRLGWDLGEGDDLHPPENIAKMAAGHPLTDVDRVPWLRRVRAWIDARLDAGRPGIITCSALKHSYRDVLRRDGVLFVELDVPARDLSRRMAERPGHFMPAALLTSQLSALEPVGPDEHAVRVDGTKPVDALVADLAALLTAQGR